MATLQAAIRTRVEAMIANTTLEEKTKQRSAVDGTPTTGVMDAAALQARFAGKVRLQCCHERMDAVAV